MCRLFDDTHGELPFVMNDPPRDAARRGVTHAGFDTQTEDNLAALFAVMLEHARHYLALYYPHAAHGEGHEGLRSDGALAAWLDELGRLVPGGVGVTSDDVDFESLARLVARIVYMASAQHELVGSFLWNYQLWTHRQPVRVYASGRPEPLDVYQRLVNANYNLNVHRRALIDDFAYLALDDLGAAAMRRFVQQLQALQDAMAREPWAAWKLYPRVLKVNINA
jgi:arachidonate 15-lipoxygenase